MKIMRYIMKNSGASVILEWSESNEELAKAEAVEGSIVFDEIEIDPNALED